MQAKWRRQRGVERALGRDPIVTPLGARRPDVFIEIHESVRLERTQKLHEESLQPRDVMRGLMKERDVVRASRQRAAIEVSRKVADASGQAGLTRLVTRDMERRQ